MLRCVSYRRDAVEALVERCRADADARQAARRPRPRLRPTSLDAGLLRYGVPAQLSVTITNSGPVAGLFHFVPPPDCSVYGEEEMPAVPAWVRASPDEGWVPAGERGGVWGRTSVEEGKNHATG
eukprot:128355-Chlamydomonas_euryale.AAC.1